MTTASGLPTEKNEHLTKTDYYQTDKELFAEILKAKDETIATQKEALSTLKEIMVKS